MEFDPTGQWIATASRDPITHEESVSDIQFTDRGRTLLTASYDGMVLRHDLPIFGSAPPAWLPELAEAVGGLRLTARGEEKIVSVNDSLRLKEKLLADDPQDEFDCWAEWFLASRRTRNVSFRTNVTTPEFVDRCLEEGTPDALGIVLRLDPTNTSALSMLQERNHSH